MKTKYTEPTNGQKQYFKIKIILFIVFAIGGWVFTESDINIDWHEEAHIHQYHSEGVEAWRSNKYQVGSSKRTITGVSAGYKASLGTAIMMYWVLFIISRSHYWICAFPMAYFLASFISCMGSIDINGVLMWQNTLRTYFIWEFGVAGGGLMLISFFIWKAVPEWVFLKWGTRDPVFR
jgi:hypothetical protein